MSRGEKTPTIGILGIVSHRRPALALRRVEEHLGNFERYRRTIELVIVDTSPSVEEREGCRQALSQVIVPRNVQLRYAGIGEKQAYLLELAPFCQRRGVDVGSVEFALGLDSAFGPKIGANRNCLLLDGIGKFLLCLDDDIVPKLGTVPGAGDEVVIVDEGSNLELWMYPDRQTACRAADLVEEPDYLSVFEKGFATHPPLGVQWPGKDVHAVSLGHVGDVGFGRPFSVMAQEGRGRAHTMNARGGYGAMRRSREGIFGVPAPTLSALNTLMMGATALCLEVDWPPFFPFGRNEDGLFAHVQRTVNPGCGLAQLPSVLLHEPPEPRSFGPWNGSYLTSRICDVVKALVSQAALESGGPPTLESLGRRLTALGELPDERFLSVLNRAWQWDYLSTVWHMEGLLARHEHSPAEWAKDVREYLEALRRSRRKPEGFVPVEIAAETESLSVAMETTRAACRGFGRLLGGWRPICDAARELGERGIRPAQSIGSQP